MDYTECRSYAERVVEATKATMKTDGHLVPMLFAFDQEGHEQVVRLSGGPDDKMSALARAAVKKVGAYAAVVANEATFAEVSDGVISKDYQWEALAVACVHPKGHVVFITPFAKEHGILFGKTKIMEGEAFSGPIVEILK